MSTQPQCLFSSFDRMMVSKNASVASGRSALSACSTSAISGWLLHRLRRTARPDVATLRSRIARVRVSRQIALHQGSARRDKNAPCTASGATVPVGGRSDSNHRLAMADPPAEILLMTTRTSTTSATAIISGLTTRLTTAPAASMASPIHRPACRAMPRSMPSAPVPEAMHSDAPGAGLGREL